MGTTSKTRSDANARPGGDAPATIGTYLLQRLHALGVEHIFGIPGDYVLGLFRLIEQSPIRHVGTTREDGAGFAADAYARLKGIGCACVTYCVGGFNTVNPIACAYAERSPVVLLSGSPGLNERVQSPFLHHMVRDFGTQKEVFERVTVASAVLDDPLTARREIDRVLAALVRYKRPVYIEVPRDLVDAPLVPGEQPTRGTPVSLPDAETDPDTLAEAIGEVRAMLAAANRPVVLAGAEIHRFGLQDELLRLVERLNVPVASTLLGKSVIREDHPLYAGVYSGLLGRDETQRLVNEADCLLLLGTILTDIDLGAYSPLVSPGRAVHATADKIAIKRHRYDNIRFEDFVTALADAPLPTFSRRSGASPSPPSLGGEAAGVTERQSAPPSLSESEPSLPPNLGGWGGQNAPATLRGLFDLVDRLITDDILVIADVGESLFAGADLHVRASAEFLSPAYYTSMGFAVPAAVGAGFAAPHRRPLVFVGDGAFQMTGTELATCVRHGQTPIIVVLNNRGYGTEREILEGPFNDIHEWQYEKVCELVGGGIAHRVATHSEAQAALEQALADRANLHVLNVLLDPSDRSPAMVRVARRLAERLSPPKATA